MMCSICGRILAFQIFKRISVGKKGNKGKVPSTPIMIWARSRIGLGGATVENGGGAFAGSTGLETVRREIAISFFERESEDREDMVASMMIVNSQS